MLGKLAAELGVVIIASLFEKRTQGIYHNTTAVLDADGIYLGKYRKMHIPDDPSYYEKFYFTPGDLGYKIFKTKYASIGVLICWDQWYPEAARITALMGAEILFYPTAIGWHISQDEATNTEQYNAWQTIQRSHAVANGVHVVSVNRCGHEQNGAMKFWEVPSSPTLLEALFTRRRMMTKKCMWRNLISIKQTATAHTGHFTRQENRLLPADNEAVY